MKILTSHLFLFFNIKIIFLGHKILNFKNIFVATLTIYRQICSLKKLGCDYLFSRKLTVFFKFFFSNRRYRKNRI
ncbi:unnamed protein product [Meloidogyne enterolobii]|uniref:Uncharacterized protein n=1 Tax=Meloidogyne enterolobii TaxID=390850 RepID=A0ACB0ZGF7_MELEN